MSYIWSDPIWRMRRLAWAFAGRLCDQYHNLMSWLNWMTNEEHVYASVGDPCGRVITGLTSSSDHMLSHRALPPRCSQVRNHGKKIKCWLRMARVFFPTEISHFRLKYFLSSVQNNSNDDFPFYVWYNSVGTQKGTSVLSGLSIIS